MNHLKQKSLSRSFRPTALSLRFSLSLVLLFGGGHCLNATAYTVNSNADTNAGAGTIGTLRFCMGLAVSPGDTIDASIIQGQTITLTAGPLPSIVNNITISGGTGVTINENSSNAAFTVAGGIAPTATIQNFTITNPVIPDTTVAAASNFAITNSTLTNLNTAGATTLNTSSLNGAVNVQALGKLTVNAGSSITATVPMTVAATGTLSATNAAITGSLVDNGATTLTDTPVTGNVTVNSTITFEGTGSATKIGSLTSSTQSKLNSNAQVTGPLLVLAGTTSLASGADILGASTVLSGANLIVSGAGSTLNTLDTFGTTTLTNNAAITGAATVEAGGTLNASTSSIINSLTSSGTSTLDNSQITTTLSVLAGTTTLKNGTDVLGASTVSAGANLKVDGIGTTLNTLDTFGTTTLTNKAAITGAATVEVGGTLNASGSCVINSLISSGTSILNNSQITTTLSVLAGTTTLENSADVLGASTVASGANLTVNGVGTTLNTLDTFGTTTLINGAKILGPATVEAGGTLNATLSTLSGALIDNGTTTLTNTPVAGAVTVGSTGTFTGTGAGTILGTSLTSSGTTTLNTNASVTGPLSVLTGTTNLQSGASVTGATTVSSGAFLNVDAASIQALDTFGTTTFNNNGTAFSGIIEPSGRLQGIGTITATINNKGGVFSPGLNGAGTFFSSVYTQSNSGTFESLVNGPTAGLSNSTTTAQIDGSLNVKISPTGIYNTVNTYKIIQASSGVTGTFSSINLSTLSLFRIIYHPTHVDIQLVPVFAMGLSGNAAATADCFLSVPPSTSTVARTDRDVINDGLFALSITEFQSAFNQMQPSQYSALNFVQLDNALNLQRSIFRHSALWKKRENFGGLPYCLPALPTSDACCHGDIFSDSATSRFHLGRSPCCLTPSAWHGWVDVTGVWQQQTSTDDQYGYHDSSGLISFGMDGTYENVSIGLLGAYQIDQLNWDNNAGDANMRTGYGGFYAMISNNNYLVDISGLIGYTTYHANRKIQFSSIHRTASASFNGYEGVVGIGLGSYNTLCGMEWIPYARVDYAYINQEGFSETRAKSLNLSVRPFNSSLMQLEFGVLLEHSCSWEYGLISPKLNLSYIGQYAVAHKHLNAHFIDIPNCSFPVRGWNFGRNLFAPTLACTFFRAGSQLAIEVGYAAQVGHRYWNQQGYLSVDMKF